MNYKKTVSLVSNVPLTQIKNIEKFNRAKVSIDSLMRYVTPINKTSQELLEGYKLIKNNFNKLEGTAPKFAIVQFATNISMDFNLNINDRTSAYILLKQLSKENINTSSERNMVLNIILETLSSDEHYYLSGDKTSAIEKFNLA